MTATNQSLNTRKQRLTKDCLPGNFWVQEGEIFRFGDHIKWGEWSKGWVVWDEEANMNDEPGIRLEGGGWGFAGWDPEHHIYTRYDSPLDDNEHCCRISTRTQF